MNDLRIRTVDRRIELRIAPRVSARQDARMRVAIHVRPSAANSMVGGEHGGVLVVRVVEPPDKGRATAAALKAVADELGVPRRCVKLTSGATSRRKVIDIDRDAVDIVRVTAALVGLLRGIT